MTVFSFPKYFSGKNIFKSNDLIFVLNGEKEKLKIIFSKKKINFLFLLNRHQKIGEQIVQ